jgi:hypothetical protein
MKHLIEQLESLTERAKRRKRGRRGRSKRGDSKIAKGVFIPSRLLKKVAKELSEDKTLRIIQGSYRLGVETIVENVGLAARDFDFTKGEFLFDEDKERHARRVSVDNYGNVDVDMEFSESFPVEDLYFKIDGARLFDDLVEFMTEDFQWRGFDQKSVEDIAKLLVKFLPRDKGFVEALKEEFDEIEFSIPGSDVPRKFKREWLADAVGVHGFEVEDDYMRYHEGEVDIPLEYIDLRSIDVSGGGYAIKVRGLTVEYALHLRMNSDFNERVGDNLSPVTGSSFTRPRWEPEPDERV